MEKSAVFFPNINTNLASSKSLGSNISVSISLIDELEM